jgi:hypothetical protein
MLHRFLPIVLVLALAAPAWAVPQTFSVQGVLRDKTGALQSMTATVTLKLFAAGTTMSGEQPLAQAVLTGVAVANGLFTVNVPLTPELSAALAQPQVWLEMTVNGDTFARQQLTPDIYALLCGTADGLSSAAVVDGAQLKPASVPASALAPAITTPAWQPLTLTSPWTNYGGSFNDAEAYLDPFGVVHLRGLVNANGAAAGGTMFTLPASLRPKNTWLLQVMVQETVGGVGTNGTGRLDIHAAGDAQINVYSKNPMSWVSLDGLTYTLN